MAEDRRRRRRAEPRVSGLGTPQSGDPSQTLDYLRGASDDIKRVGTEAVRGSPTTHYSVVLDLEKAAASSPNGRQTIQSLIKILGFSKLPAEVWVDGEGRLRKLRYTADLSKSRVAASARSAPGSLTFTLELFDFGVPVQVAVPLAGQVADLGATTPTRKPGA